MRVGSKAMAVRLLVHSFDDEDCPVVRGEVAEFGAVNGAGGERLAQRGGGGGVAV